jgi:hypothetical protein
MKTELENGCKDQYTLSIYNLFSSQPHCIDIIMYREEEEDFDNVLVTFQHYNDQFEVVFNTTTEVGVLSLLPELKEYPEEIEASPVFYGSITVTKLLSLFDRLPHLLDYVEDDLGAIIH